MSRLLRWRAVAIPAAVTLAAVTATAAPTLAASGGYSPHGAAARQQAYRAHAKAAGGTPTATHTPDDGNLADRAASYAWERSAPAATVPGPALTSGVAAANALPVSGGPWSELTTKPYNAEPAGYSDPFWSNVGAGYGIVGGRTTALATAADGSWIAGTADGGIWRSTDSGGTWTPVFDSAPSLSIGAVAAAPDGSLYAGTGESNTSQDSYAGAGVYRSTDNGQTWAPVTSGDGSNPVAGRTVFRLAFSGGTVLAATNDGLWRYDGTTWTDVLATPQAGDPTPYYDDQVSDVVVQPGTDGQGVLAVIGWRGPLTAYNQNGIFASTDGGQTFHAVSPAGIDTADLGRTTLAYSADGSKLYAVVESPAALAAGSESVLKGVYVTTSSDASAASPAGSWIKIADEGTLARSGSALPVGSGYGVGVQAWYNQFLTVDPADPDHVYLGLEEVFETTNGGTSWVTASPYWNYGLACGTSCPKVTHADQHAVMVTGDTVVIGNDGGIYSRALSDHNQYGGWSDLNATLRDLQYYDARAGDLNGGVGVWGGLQDNGTSLLDPTQSQMVQPAGGDGFDVIVDPANASRMVGEYVDGAMYSSTDGGHTFNSYVSPSCVGQETVGLPPRHDCDPNFRFVAPLIQDQTNANTWLAGGEDVWVSHAGWNTRCGTKGCTWGKQFDTGAGNAVTALSSANDAIYAGWVHGGGNPGSSFRVGLATNVGGSWHQLPMTGLPNRYISGVTVDKANPNHAIVVFNGYSRRWIPGGGTGHVFETWNAGQSWTDIDGNLPDLPGDALVIAGHTLALATDAGVFTATDGTSAGSATPTWSRLGSGLPNTSVNDLTVGPDGALYAATHGRGVWKLSL